VFTKERRESFIHIPKLTFSHFFSPKTFAIGHWLSYQIVLLIITSENTTKKAKSTVQNLMQFIKTNNTTYTFSHRDNLRMPKERVTHSVCRQDRNHSLQAICPHISSEMYGDSEVSFLQFRLLQYPVNFLSSY